MLSNFLLKSDKFLKHYIPEAFRKVPEDYPEAKPEGKYQYAKHRIPEAIRKVPEDCTEADPEGHFQKEGDVRINDKPHIHVHIYICIYVYIYICIYTHICIHIFKLIT